MNKKIISQVNRENFPWLKQEKDISLGYFYSSTTSIHQEIFKTAEQICSNYRVPLLMRKYGSLGNIIVGGDGTVISTVRNQPDFDVPVFAVQGGTRNAAHTLNSVNIADTLTEFIKGNYELSPRNTLETFLPLKIVKKDKYGFNIYKFSPYTKDTLRQIIINEIKIHSFDNSCLRIKLEKFEELVNIHCRGDSDFTSEKTFDANGLLIATALGSTAENSNGGGIELNYEDDSFVLLPIFPMKNLSYYPELLLPQMIKREIEIPDKMEITITYTKPATYGSLGFGLYMDNLNLIHVPRRKWFKKIDQLCFSLSKGPNLYLVKPKERSI